MRLRLNTTVRRRLCAWLAGALLMMQWLVTAHACPVPPAPLANASALVAHAAALPCHDSVAEADDAVCLAHCTGDEQAPAQPLAVDDLAQLAGGWCLMLTLPVLPANAGLQPSCAAEPAASPPGWPPIYIVNGALRN